MGYLGSSLDDYFSYQLLDKVGEQIDNSNTGDLEKLQDSLNIIVKKFASHNKRVTARKPRPKSTKATS